MIKKIALVAADIKGNELLRALFLSGRDRREQFCEKFRQLTRLNSCFFVNSGTAAFFLGLEALKKISSKTEVILPAYTAGSLLVAVKKAGLKPILCDIRLTDFNLDLENLAKLVNQNTLAIVAVHLFGLVMPDLGMIKQRYPDVFLIEDCAQSLGGLYHGQALGNSGDLAVFSFNRGKNFSLYSGGCLATNQSALAKVVQRLNSKLVKQNLSFINDLKLYSQFCALAFVTKPYIYGLVYPWIISFKQSKPPNDFSLAGFGRMQAAFALARFDRFEQLSQKRYQQGMFMLKNLAAVKTLILPQIDPASQPVFNRLPVLFKDNQKLKIAQAALWQAGIESNQMYLKPLHKMFDLGLNPESYPQANFLARNLLTLPTHPRLTKRDLEMMVKVLEAII